MPSFQNPADYQHAKDLLQGSTVEANAFLALKRAAERGNGVIPAKTRELISVAVSSVLTASMFTPKPQRRPGPPLTICPCPTAAPAVMRMYAEAPSPVAASKGKTETT